MASHPPSPPTQRAPSLRRRMACWTYEGVLLFGVVVLTGLVFGIATNTRHGLEHRHGLQAMVFVVLGIYFVYFWNRGQTLPMRTWRLRIVDRQGRSPRWPRALMRYLLSWLWFLPPLALLMRLPFSAGQATTLVLGWVVIWALLSRFHPQRQFLHDALAGTRLVDAPPPSQPQSPDP